MLSQVPGVTCIQEERPCVGLLTHDESMRGQAHIGPGVILAELIGPLPLNSPDRGCQNYNCVSQSLASSGFVMRRV